jgi:hypothetical protein
MQEPSIPPLPHDTLPWHAKHAANSLLLLLLLLLQACLLLR